MKPEAPDIPAPRPDDEEYMKLCRKYLQDEIDKYSLERELCTWRRAFYTVAITLLVLTFTMLVFLVGRIV